jgi:hypothetical protein
MTLHERAAAGSEHAPVAAPLGVLVACALLVLTQLYLAIPLAEVIGRVLELADRPPQPHWARPTRWPTVWAF